MPSFITHHDNRQSFSTINTRIVNAYQNPALFRTISNLKHPSLCRQSASHSKRRRHMLHPSINPPTPSFPPRQACKGICALLSGKPLLESTRHRSPGSWHPPRVSSRSATPRAVSTNPQISPKTPNEWVTERAPNRRYFCYCFIID